MGKSKIKLEYPSPNLTTRKLKMKNLIILLLLAISANTYLTAESLPIKKTSRRAIKKSKVIEKKLSLAPITQFDLAINKANVYVKPGNKQEIIVKGQRAVIQQLNTEVVDGNWQISLPETIKKHKYLSINITLPELKGVTNSSGGQVIATGEFRATHDLWVLLTGTGEVRLDGSANKVYVKNTGVGTIDLSNFIMMDCDVQIIGLGICKVNPKNILSSSVVGGGKLIYRSAR